MRKRMRDRSLELNSILRLTSPISHLTSITEWLASYY